MEETQSKSLIISVAIGVTVIGALLFSFSGKNKAAYEPGKYTKENIERSKSKEPTTVQSPTTPGKAPTAAEIPEVSHVASPVGPPPAGELVTGPLPTDLPMHVPADLPKELKEQLFAPPQDLPPELREQLLQAAPPLPEDLSRALEDQTKKDSSS